MEKLKKLSKHILGTMIALCGLLFVSHPVYAGTIVLDNANNRIITAVKDNAPYSHLYTVAYLTGASTSKANLKPIIIDYGTGHYCVLSNVDEGGFLWYKSGGFYGYDITSIDDYLTGSVEVEETKIDDSTPNLLSFYKSMNTGYSGSASMYDYMISKGYSAADLDKYLNHYKIVRMTGDSTPASARADGYKVDLNGCIVVTPEQLYSMVKTAVDTGDGSKIFDQEDDTGDNTDYLPMLSYSLKRKTVIGFPSITQIKENLTWDYTEKELYKDNPTKYNVEVWVSANWKAAPTGIGNIRDVSNMQFNDKAKLAIDSAIPIVKNSYGWLYSDKGKKLYKEAGENWGDESGYNLFIRTYEVGGSKVSYWKVYNLALGGYVQQEDTLIDENGNKVPISKDDYDIGNTEHDGKNKDDQSSDAPFSTDNKDDADESPTSDFNKSNGNYSIDSFLGSIKNVINTISGIPSLLSSLASWLDPRLIALITASIALVISIGVVKMIL